MKTNNSDSPIDELLRRSLPADPPESLDDSLDPAFEQLRRQLDSEELPPTPVADRLLFLVSGLHFRISAAASCLVLAAVFLLGPSRELTWAEVVQRFKGVKTFSVTLYQTTNPLEAPDKTELWVGEHRSSRVHNQGRVFFGRKGKVSKVFDVTSRKEIAVAGLSARELKEANLANGVHITRMLGDMKELSLDAIVKTFCGKMTYSPPLPAQSADIARDLKVFDLRSDRSTEWVRIWTLKSSGLPTRIRVWDPRRGDSIEAVFDYSAPQPDAAFDPDRFASDIASKSSLANRLYHLIADPGKQAVTPGDLFHETGYHMPEVVAMGQTPEGVVWIKSKRARNRKPDGGHFFGFGRLTDEHGQEYLHQFRHHHSYEDVTLEYHIPFDYGVGYRQPTRFTLTCWSQPISISQPGEIVGSTNITSWEPVARLPAREGISPPTTNDLLATLAREVRHREDWDRFDQLVALIAGKAEESRPAYIRDTLIMEKHSIFERNDQAFDMAQGLYVIAKPHLGTNYFGHSTVLREYLRGLTRAGKTAMVKATVATIYESLRVNRPEQVKYFVGNVLFTLRQFSSLKNPWALIPPSALDDPEIIEHLRQSGVRQTTSHHEDPAYQPWRNHAAKVFSQLQDRPFPAPVTILTDLPPFTQSDRTYRIDFPNRPELQLLRLKVKPSNLLFYLAWEQQQKAVPMADFKNLPDEPHNLTIVVRREVSSMDLYTHVLRSFNLVVRSTKIRRPVWVAQYDGRQLPNWRTVFPLSADHLGSARIRGSSSRNGITELLRLFAQSANSDLDRQSGLLTPDHVVIIDETGLPTERGPNQSWGSLNLSSGYAFWSGDEGTKLGREWFKNTFGITFKEEAREIEVLKLARAE